MSSATLHPDLASLYDDLAPDYDRLHRRWLRHAGGEAQAALEAAVRVVATPNMELLDAGCGTGAFARRLLADIQIAPRITLLDPSEAMLARCADIPAKRVQGRLEKLPFGRDHFDIVSCAWALETTTNLERSVTELCRVVRPGGLLCLAFCAQTASQSILGRAMALALSIRGSGRLLLADEIRTALAEQDSFELRHLPCNGPAAALIVRKTLEQS